MSTSDARASDGVVRTVWSAAAAGAAVLGVVLIATGAGPLPTLAAGIAVGGFIVAAQRSGGRS